MIETKMTPEFQKEIVDFLEERIKEMKGHKTCYGADLTHEMTLDENNTGAWVVYIKRANAFVKHFRKDALDTIAYYRSDFGADFIDEKLEIGEYGEPWEYFETEYDEEGNVVSEEDYDDIDLILANNNSEILTFFMLYYGVNQIVPFMTCVEENWNKDIFFDDEFIQTFLSELKPAEDETTEENEETRASYGKLRRFVEFTLDRGYLNMGDGRIDLRRYKRLSDDDKMLYAQDVIREFGFEDDDQKALSIVRPIFG